MRSIVSIRHHWASTVCGAVLGLLLLIPVSPHAAEFVLCLESTGQVNVESAEAGGGCAERPEVVVSNERTVLASRSGKHCPGCSDIPLHLTEADDPCGTAITPSPLTLDAPSEQLSLTSTQPAADSFVATVPSTSSRPPMSLSVPSEAGPDASLGSVVLLV